MSISDLFMSKYPHEIIISYRKVLRTFQIQKNHYIFINNDMFYYATRFSLYNLINIDTHTKIKEKYIRDVIISNFLEYTNGQSVVYHITRNRTMREIKFT